MLPHTWLAGKADANGQGGKWQQGWGDRTEGSYVDVGSPGEEKLDHICVATVGGVVQRLSPALQSPVYILVLRKHMNTHMVVLV